MNILKENMEELLMKTNYTIKKEYEDVILNTFLNYWSFCEEKESILQVLTNETLEVILYSKYYWCSRYKERFLELYGTDAGVEQQQYKIIEELEQRVQGAIDWKLLQVLEEERFTILGL